MPVIKKKQKQEYPIFREIIKQTLKRSVVKEFKFHPKRKWLFDFAVPDLKIAVEIEGGIFAQKRLGHSTGAAIKKDMEKYNAAQLMGWKVLRYMPEQDGECMRDLEIVKRGNK